MLGTCPLSDLPICDTLQDDRFLQSLVFTETVSSTLVANRILSDSLTLVHLASGYTNTFPASDTLSFTQSAIYNSPMYRTAAQTLNIVQAAYVLWKPLGQLVSQELNFADSAEHNLKIGYASDHLTLVDSANHNQKNVIAYNTLTFLQRLTVKGPVYATAENILEFNEYLASTPLYLEVSDTLDFNDSLDRQHFHNVLVCDCLDLEDKVRKIIEETAENELVFSGELDEHQTFDHLIFTEVASHNLEDATCCTPAYFPDIDADDSLTFVQVATYQMIYQRSVSQTVTMYGSVTKVP